MLTKARLTGSAGRNQLIVLGWQIRVQWWNRIKARNSFMKASAGVGSREQQEYFVREGHKIVGQARQILHEIMW